MPRATRPLRLFVSSTFEDLQEHRRAVIDALQRLDNVRLVAAESYAAEQAPAVERVVRDVDDCDLLVLIVAFRYGYVPPSYDKSITELTFDRAGERMIPRLVFLLDEDTPWPRKMMDAPREKEDLGRRIDSFRDRLQKAVLVGRFKTPADLVTSVVAAVAREQQRWMREGPVPRRPKGPDDPPSV